MSGKFSSTHDIGDLVYLAHDKDQSQRMVVKICFNYCGPEYCLTSGTTTSWHTDIEISAEPNTLFKVK